MRNLTGQSLGTYTLENLVNSGGVADVYRARSTIDGQIVAVKVMKPEMLKTEKLLDRFLQEAQMMITLAHPHILRVYETGTFEQSPYIVMQYAEGGSLADRVERQPLTFHEISRTVAQIAAALDFAHAHNTIHRDIKLENVLLDAQGNVLLSDFGMAKSLVAKGDLRTAKGVMLGTPYYVSPEQAAGKTVDARSDVYSLGVLVFKLITGQFPFAKPLPIAVISQHIREKPPLITSINPNFPQPLAEAVDRALSKKPADRFQTAGELALAVQKSLTLEQKGVEPVRTPAPTPKRPAPSRADSRLSVSPALLLSIIALVVIWIAILFVVLLNSISV